MNKASLLLLLLTAACSLISDQSSILDDSECELPCWSNITPGQTSQQEALQVIEYLDGIDQKSIVVNSQPREIFHGRLNFSLYQNSLQNPTDGEIYFINDKVVALIITRNLGLTFGDMVQRIGEPNNIISIPFHGANPVVMAINPLRGIKFELYAKSNDLQPETRIDTIMLFDAKYYEDLLEVGMFSTGEYDAEDTQKIMYPWKGYGSIDELYPPIFP